MESTQVVPVIVPTAEEAEALAIAARFLHRSQRHLAAAVRGDALGYHHALMLAELRDQCAEAAMLCEGLEFMTG